MSASQTPSPGRTPNGHPLPPSLRRKPADPLVRRKRPDPTRPTPRTAPSQVNGGSKPNAINATPSPRVQASSVAQNNTSTAAPPPPPQEEYEDFPVFTTRRALLQGARHHVMRLLPNTSTEVKVVDPADESQFVRPVKLHRRDPRARPEMQWRDASPFSSDNDTKANSAMDDKERARREAEKAEKRAEREANQAQIAPTTKKPPAPKKKQQLQNKTELVYKFSDSATKEKNQRIRYEESLPWHLEDFDNKNIWAGSYEAALSECHVILVKDPTTGAFQMTPVEKWYKFTPKNQFKTLSIEEAEARMSKKIKDPRWFMESQKEDERAMQEQQRSSNRSSVFTRQGERGERPQKNSGDDMYEKPEEIADADDIDYDYEEAFADDEENALFEGDKEESKQAEEKLMRERREANVFEIKEERDYDEEEQEEKRRAEEEKKLKKKIEKALMKRERNYVYEDDSDRNPYASESESEDSDEANEEMKDVNDEDKPKDPQDPNSGDRLKVGGQEKVPSGASSRGTNTPSGRKTDDPSRKKRRVSPNLSEASGNESSRKKAKKSHVASQLVDQNATGLSISRPTSPANSTTSGPGISRKGSSIKLNLSSSKDGGAGSGSDAEKSDASKARKANAKLRAGATSKSASPNGSRAGSPTPAGAQAESQSAQKATNADSEPPPPLPTPEDIRARISADGTELPELVKVWGRRVVKRPDFVPLIKAHATWNKDTKKFYPKVT